MYSDVKSWLIGKEPDAGKDWGLEEKGATEDEMVGWHHQLDGCGFGWTPGLIMDREAWRAAVHGVTKSRTWIERLNWTELNWNSTHIPHLLLKTWDISPKDQADKNIVYFCFCLKWNNRHWICLPILNHYKTWQCMKAILFIHWILLGCDSWV